MGQTAPAFDFRNSFRRNPEAVRIVPVLLVLAFAPIAFLFYWMWRVRVRGRLAGIVIGAARSR